ncbi:MAG: hypothetical protein QXD88_00830, partial [Candidatus Anstonellales archaeon]
ENQVYKNLSRILSNMNSEIIKEKLNNILEARTKEEIKNAVKDLFTTYPDQIEKEQSVLLAKAKIQMLDDLKARKEVIVELLANSEHVFPLNSLLSLKPSDEERVLNLIDVINDVSYIYKTANVIPALQYILLYQGNIVRDGLDTPLYDGLSIISSREIAKEYREFIKKVSKLTYTDEKVVSISSIINKFNT